MPRLARLPSIPFGLYYVALHSVMHRRILTSHSDLMIMLKLLRATLRKRGARLHAGYVDEHEVHLALQVGETQLSAITGTFQHEYARVFNQIHDEHGSLFRLHHHELLIQHQRWLVPLVHFIHWIRRLARPVDHQGGLWWSSDAVYRGTEKQGWITTNLVLRMLTRGAYNRRVQEQTYREFFADTPDPNHARFFKRGSEEEPRILGDAQFVTVIWRRIGRRSPDRLRHPRYQDDEIAEVVRQLIREFNSLCDQRFPARRAVAMRRIATYENLLSRSRKRPLPMLRALCVSYLIDHEFATPAQAAHFLGCGPRPVSAPRRRLYAALFLEWFGAEPEVLIRPRDRGT